MVMAVADAGSSSSSSSSSYELVICLEVVITLFVVEILLSFFLGNTLLAVVTSGSVIVLSGDVNHPLSCFLTSLLQKYTSLFKIFFTKVNYEKFKTLKKENEKI